MVTKGEDQRDEFRAAYDHLQKGCNDFGLTYDIQMGDDMEAESQVRERIATSTPESWGTSVNREQLVHLCARLTGSFDCADDLAQQTLLEAWLHEEKLRDPSRRTQWLNGIARNVCRRWARSRGREPVLQYIALEDAPGGPDIEVDLERDELAALLDKALDLLRPEERTLLIAHYIDGLPKKELAERLGVQPGTLAVRLHRGRLALRGVISTRLRE